MALKIAILVNHPPTAHFHSEIQQGFTDSFTEIAPTAQLQFFDPYAKQEYPDPSNFDLIILSGGKADGLENVGLCKIYGARQPNDKDIRCMLGPSSPNTSTRWRSSGCTWGANCRFWSIARW